MHGQSMLDDAAARNNAGVTALHTAAEPGREGVVRMQLSAEAVAQESGLDGFTALYWAVQNGH